MTTTPAAADPYELGEELGVGAVATVHRAVDARSGAAVAVKILHPRNARDPTAMRRFAREVELARTLRDPHIVAVHEATQIAGRPALVMELVEGPTLAEIIAREAPLEEARLLRLARDLARGLAVAHAGGVIHRDLKPANVLVSGGEGGEELAKIADFGMARATSFAGVDRESMTVLGTPDYMAPETLDPMAVDPRADLYALGCILFEMAEGRPPFRGATPFALLEAHRKQTPPEIRADYSPALRELVGDLLAKQPSDRPHAASAVLAALEALLHQGGGSEALVPAGEDLRGLLRARPRDLLEAAARGRCARCGAPVITGVRVCLDCGLQRVKIERGGWSVFVVGPGVVGDKLASPLRDRLLAWVRANPDSGLLPGALAQRIPRLPVPVALRISRASAQALVSTLGQLGLRAEPRPGGRLAHGQMMEKTLRIGARRTKLALPLLIIGLPVVAVLFVLLLPLMPFYFAAIGWWTSRPVLETRPDPPRALPPAVEEHLREVERKAPLLGRRHRPALRAVVHRVMALLEATPADAREGLDAEMAHALSVAVVASTRLDELDAWVSRPEFDAGDLEQRRDLQERDMWSARLLDLTATLDALVSRQRAASHALRAAELERDSPLDELRDRVEALEEVQRGT